MGFLFVCNTIVKHFFNLGVFRCSGCNINLYMSVPWKYYSKYTKPLCMVEFAIIINSIVKEVMRGIFAVFNCSISRLKYEIHLKEVLLLFIMLPGYFPRCRILEI